MRWLTFMLLAALMLTLQSTVAPHLALFGARPDLLLPVVVFFALHAPPRDAIVGGWLIGLCADLMSVERLGLIALSYVLVATGVVSVREHLFRYSHVTQFVVALLACFMVRVGWIVYCRVLYSVADSLLVDLMTNVLLVSVYTAAWAPLLHTALLRMSPVFRMARPRYTYARQGRTW
jgi:rod shape-determining protein MreD